MTLKSYSNVNTNISQNFEFLYRDFHIRQPVFISDVNGLKLYVGATAAVCGAQNLDQ